MLVTDLRGRLALVTGATGGIGSATCKALALLGCSVAVHYNSAASAAQDLVVELRKYNVTAECFRADLSEYQNVKLLHKRVTEKMGSPNILFNNAGITVKHGVKDIAEVSIEVFEHTWRANCGSAFLLTQLCLPAMEKVGWGRIIFCSNVAGFTGGVVGPHYAYVWSSRGQGVMAESSSQILKISSPWLDSLAISDLLRQRYHCQRSRASFDSRYGHAAWRFGRTSKEQASCSEVIY